MTEPATGATHRAITDRLTAALAPSQLEVVNESAKHRGHTGDDGSGETHWQVRVTSAAFAGQSRVARHRLVNRALAGLMDNPIHALAIDARAPGEG